MIQAFGRCGDIKTAFALGKKVPDLYSPIHIYTFALF